MKKWKHGGAPECAGRMVGFATAVDGASEELGAGDHPIACVVALRVECDCGWVSPRFQAPLGTCWDGVNIDAPTEFSSRAEKLWLSHARKVEAALRTDADTELTLEIHDLYRERTETSFREFRDRIVKLVEDRRG